MASLSPDEIAYQQAHITDDQGPKIIGISIFLVVISTLVVSLRLLARFSRKMSLSWDDAFCIFALLFTICMPAINIVSVHFGLGKHLLATDPKVGYKILQAGWFLSLDYAISQWFIKMTFLLTYIRIFTLGMKWFRYAVWFVMFYVSAWSFALVVVALSECRPISIFWQQYNTTRSPPASGACYINNNATEVSTSALNTIADFMILVLPLLVIWKLQLTISKKIAVSAIFAVGLFACVASILRTMSTRTAITTTSDSTWATVGVYLWTAVEASVGLMCSCFPVVGPLFSSAFDHVKSVISNSNSSSRQSLFRSRHSKSSQSPKLHRRTESQSSGNTSERQRSVDTKEKETIDSHYLDLPTHTVLREDTYQVESQPVHDMV